MAKQREHREHKKYTKPEVKYEDIAGRMNQNIEDFEAFYFAALMKSGEHGKEGQRDGLYASLWGLKNKIGLEGILNVLEAQAEAYKKMADISYTKELNLPETPYVKRTTTGIDHISH